MREGVPSEKGVFEQRPEVGGGAEQIASLFWAQGTASAKALGQKRAGLAPLWPGSQGGKGYTKFPSFSKSTGGNGAGQGGEFFTFKLLWKHMMSGTDSKS